MSNEINIEIKSGTFKNMPIVEKHYLPLFSGLKQHLLTAKLTNKKKNEEWEKLKLEIESDLLNQAKLYNKETMDYCHHRLFPAIDLEIKKNKTAFSPQQNKKKNELKKPKTFEELFYNTDLVVPCIDILKELEPPLIDAEFNYIGKLKGAFCVWIDEMRSQGIIKHFSDRKIFASLIPQKIKRFSIDESMFGKPQSRAEEKYKTDIKTLLSQIKLSQNSQKGKLGK